MEQYDVTGMSCAACQVRVEKAVSAIEGVTSATVSLLTNSMAVEGTASSQQIIKAVEDAGYGASLRGGRDERKSLSDKLAAEEEALKDRETPRLRRRLIASLAFLLVLMYFSMGHMMLGLPLPSFFEGNHLAVAIVQLVLCAIVMVINQKFFVSGFRSLWHRAPNMDSLNALGSMASFVYSVVILLLMSRAVTDGNDAQTMAYMNELYFESSAMILALITVGKMLEAYSKGKTTNALKSLMKLAPRTVNLIRDGQEVTVSIDEVSKGDIFVVRPGENIPVDGIVIEGQSAVNEAAITGESIPVDKSEGDEVTSATLNQSGFLKCRASRVGEDTTLAQIIQLVSDAAATKAPVARLADTISGYFVPAVIAISLITFVIWLLTGKPIGFCLARAITVLVVSCPCALGLATPVAIMVGNGVGAKNGILFKNAEALQETGNVQIVVLDKTGTITTGQPVLTGLYPAEGVSEEALLDRALALEKRSEHPLARAIVSHGEEKGIESGEIEDFRALSGSGVTGRYRGKELCGGNLRFISAHAEINEEARQTGARLAEAGQTPLYFAEEGKLLGIIAVADAVKPDSPQAIEEMRNMGIHVVMLTGDNEATAQAIGRQAGVSEVVASVMPEGKEEIIRQLQAHGKVAMVGDGINDAPALTRADIGIAIGAGTDVAIDAADAVLMKSSLRDAAAAIRLSRATYRNILENLFWALIYNTLLIPAAAGLYNRLGITMNPMLGAAAMSLSSFCVVSNALRLNLLKIHDGSRDRPGRRALDPKESILEERKEEEVSSMTRTMKIEGMMCPHCEATVKKALEAVEGVESAQVSHEKGQAIVTVSHEIDDSVLIKAVEDREYKVTGIE